MSVKSNDNRSVCEEIIIEEASPTKQNRSDEHSIQTSIQTICIDKEKKEELQSVSTVAAAAVVVVVDEANNNQNSNQKAG